MPKDPKEMTKQLIEKLTPDELHQLAKFAQSSLPSKIDSSAFTPPLPISRSSEAEIIRLLQEAVRLLTSVDRKLK